MNLAMRPKWDSTLRQSGWLSASRNITLCLLAIYHNLLANSIHYNERVFSADGDRQRVHSLLSVSSELANEWHAKLPREILALATALCFGVPIQDSFTPQSLYHVSRTLF
jgi:hypothetical protein